LKRLATVIDADKVPLVAEQFLTFGFWLLGLVAKVFASALTWSTKAATLGFFSVPFILAVPVLEPEFSGALFAAAVLAAGIPAVRARFG
jgi:hypothetical protein